MGEQPLSVCFTVRHSILQLPKATFRWLRMHHTLLLYGLDLSSNQYLMIICTYHPTPVSPIEPFCADHDYSQPILLAQQPEYRVIFLLTPPQPQTLIVVQLF